MFDNPKKYIRPLCNQYDNDVNLTLSNACHGVGDRPMSCKPRVAGSIPGFSQSVG